MRRREFMGAAALGILGAGVGGSGTRERLCEEARRIFAANFVESRLGKFHLPSYSTYKRFYAWDSGWNIISQTAFDPAGAVDELEAVFNFQVESGRVPHEAVPPELDKERDSAYSRNPHMFDEQARSHLLDPPSYLMGAEEAWKKTGDRRVLALLPKMEKCLEYLLRDRDLFGDGLTSVIHRWEPGTDMAPSFDQIMSINPLDPFASMEVDRKGDAMLRRYAELGWDLGKIRDANLFIVEEPGINAITAAGAVSVSRLFREAGDEMKADKWLSRAKDLVAAMEAHLWDDKRGFFYPRFDVKDPKLCGRASLTGLVVLMTGLVSEDKAERVMKEWLLNPRHFWSGWPVPFNSVAEMKRDPALFERGHLWRGSCIWINMNWMAARVLQVCGHEEEAREMTKRTAQMIDANGFREYYRPRTGRGVGADHFTWPALILRMIEEYGLED